MLKVARSLPVQYEKKVVKKTNRSREFLPCDGATRMDRDRIRAHSNENKLGEGARDLRNGCSGGMIDLRYILFVLFSRTPAPEYGARFSACFPFFREADAPAHLPEPLPGRCC